MYALNSLSAVAGCSPQVQPWDGEDLHAQLLRDDLGSLPCAADRAGQDERREDLLLLAEAGDACGLLLPFVRKPAVFIRGGRSVGVGVTEEVEFHAV